MSRDQGSNAKFAERRSAFVYDSFTKGPVDRERDEVERDRRLSVEKARTYSTHAETRNTDLPYDETSDEID